MTETLNLTVSRVVTAPVDRVFAAWTEAAHVRRWFGPRDVRCIGAEIDLRVGGRYRIGNLLPNGQEIWIVGEFEAVAPPRQLVYTWRIEPATGAAERVTVRFEPRGMATEVTVTHERIRTEAVRRSHEAGWTGCLDGLAGYLVS